jgi:hypothetical protein
VRFGIVTDQNLPWSTLVERWRLFEALGFDSAWDCDHFVQPSRPTGPYFEAWTLLAALAAISIVSDWRARQLQRSGTRRCWPRPSPSTTSRTGGSASARAGTRPEHPCSGSHAPASLSNAFAAVGPSTLLRNDTTFRPLLSVASAMRPRPGQPRPPLMLAAHRRKILRIVAAYADTWNSFGTVDEMRARNAILDEHCAAIGRDPGQSCARCTVGRR